MDEDQAGIGGTPAADAGPPSGAGAPANGTAPPAPDSAATPAPVAGAPSGPAVGATPMTPLAPISPAPAPSPTSAAVPADSPPARRRGGGRGRPILLGFLVVLTCVSMVTSLLLVWSHQVLLNTDRYVQVAERVASDPTVIAGTADRLATQITTAVALDTKLAAVLPDKMQPLAPLIGSAIQDSLARQIQRGLATDQFQSAWAAANRVAHEAMVKLLRGDTTAVTIVDGKVTLNLLPIVQQILVQLQTAGIIPASVTIPDLSDPANIDGSIAKLAGALGVTLPPDFGQIALADSTKLEQAQALVRIFDIVVVVSLLLTLALIVVTILLARHRLRMGIILAIGAAISYLLTGLAVHGAESAVVSAVAAGNGEVLKAAMYDLTEDLIHVAGLIAIAAIVVAIVLYLASRPAWLVRLLDRDHGTAAAEDAAAA
jgi:hypothetical protein